MWLTPFDTLLSPLDAALRLAAGSTSVPGRAAGLAWLDGGLEHGRDGRFSFVGSAPCAVIERAHGAPDALAALDQVTLTDAPARAPLPHESADSPPPAISTALTAERVPLWVGHVAYDAVRATARAEPRGKSEPSALPSLRFARYDAWFAFDHATQRSYLVGDDRAACERLSTRLAAAPVTPPMLAFASSAISATPHEQHRAAVRAALALIREGELYEINLARRYRASFTGSALGLFLRLRELSPVPLGFFVDAGSHAIAGRSMECFLRFDARDRSLSSSPIKGTLARRGDDVSEASQLARDPKERAEHAMVVDLMRNDLSRVCQVGSVEVSELMTVLPFAGLSHLVSTVRGTMRPEVTLRGLFEQTFPPGSVTGAPKERVMRAIDALESVPRGVYTGCTGYIDRSGGCSFAVAIRSAMIADGVVDYFAGGGIVADSDPQREADETDLKAELFLRALQ